jgi:hypothetical protein
VTWAEEQLFSPRYAGAAAPVLLAIYFIWESSGPASVRLAGRTLLFTIVTSALLLNWIEGLKYIKDRAALASGFVSDVKAGLPIPHLVAKYSGATYHLHEILESYLESLRGAGIGDFAHLPASPSFREVRLPLQPSRRRNIEWNGSGGRVIGPRAYVRFDLRSPTFVAGIRIKYSSKNQENLNPIFRVWLGCGKAEDESYFVHYIHRDLPRNGEVVEVPIWLYRELRWIRIQPDKRPCDFTLPEIILRIPESESERRESDGDDYYYFRPER